MNASHPPLAAPALVELAERYFAAVDRHDLPAVLACFAPEARFSIATYSTLYTGRDSELRAMFERLNARYAKVWHGHFEHVVDVAKQCIASRFEVENITHDGQTLLKNNCNFFRLQDGLFVEVFVYMSGDNSLG